MNDQFVTDVREDTTLRQAFNALTRQTFGFDFEGWYGAGHWGDLYIPHALWDGEKIISNISVNLMNFVVDGTVKKYIQLGTVMTDADCRGKGFNREIMERILDKYAGTVDGIYLFANDRVLDYYPKFDFTPVKEYEYYMPCQTWEDALAYEVEPVDWADEKQCRKLYEKIKRCAAAETPNPNDALYMLENLGLYQFWLAADYGESVFYLPKEDAYVIAEAGEERLHIIQMIGDQRLDIRRLAKTLGGESAEAVLGFTPMEKEALQVREHEEEDTTLFILGSDLERMEREKMMFPILSHA